MCPQLLYGSGSECVAGGDQNPALVLDQPEANLGQVGALAHAVHAAKGYHVRPLVGLGLQHVADDVDAAFRGQKFDQRVVERGFHRAMDGRKSA